LDRVVIAETSVSIGKPFHFRESGNTNDIFQEIPGSREFIFT
jgi:hypothetical protein